MSPHANHHHHHAGQSRKRRPAVTPPPEVGAPAAPPLEPPPASPTQATSPLPPAPIPVATSRPPDPATTTRAPGPVQTAPATRQLASTASTPSTAPARSTAGPGVLLRVIWMGLGNLALAGLAVTITQAGGRFGIRDLLYGALIALLAWVRWFDIARFAGTTADGRPATLAHLRRYVVLLVAVGAGVWVVAHLAGRWLGAA